MKVNTASDDSDDGVYSVYGPHYYCVLVETITKRMMPMTIALGLITVMMMMMTIMMMR